MKETCYGRSDTVESEHSLDSSDSDSIVDYCLVFRDPAPCAGIESLGITGGGSASEG